jgi:hypothetical protein
LPKLVNKGLKDKGLKIKGIRKDLRITKTARTIIVVYLRIP